MATKTGLCIALIVLLANIHLTVAPGSGRVSGHVHYDRIEFRQQGGPGGCTTICADDSECCCAGCWCENGGCNAIASAPQEKSPLGAHPGFEQALNSGDTEENVNNPEYILISINMMKFFCLIVALIVIWNIILNVSNCRMRQRLKEIYQDAQEV